MYELVEEYRVDNEAAAANGQEGASTGDDTKDATDDATPFVTLQAIIPRSPHKDS